MEFQAGAKFFISIFKSSWDRYYETPKCQYLITTLYNLVLPCMSFIALTHIEKSGLLIINNTLLNLNMNYQSGYFVEIKILCSKWNDTSFLSKHYAYAN